MAKPRTNYDACAYWAESILANEPAPAIDVNSIIVRNDTVFSFGSHYPMGVIQRDKRGRAVRVVLNNDFYPSRGFANTPGDQWAVKSCALDAVARSPREIEVKYQLLSAYKTNGKIRVRPRADDPEPPSDSRMEVPRRFTATYPGPEPVDDGEGCIAGERFGVSEWKRTLMRTDEIRDREDERPVVLDELMSDRKRRVWSHERHVLSFIDAVMDGRELLWVKTWVTSWTEWGTERWSRAEGATYAQCPHCTKFQSRHDAWRRAMHGGYGVRGGGWLAYQANLQRYGGWDGWLAAWRTDRDRVRAERQAYAEWHDRNHVPLERVRVENGVPRTDSEGYAYRVDALGYWKERRAREREMRRMDREARERARERRQIERFHARMAKQRGISFERAAANAASEIRTLRLVVSDGVRTDDSQEVA